MKTDYRAIGHRLFSQTCVWLAVSAFAVLAAPGWSSAQSITIPHPAVQAPWATGQTAFGHIKSKTGALDALGSAPGQSYFPYAQVWLNDGHGNFSAGDQLQAPLGNAVGFTLADLNGDGFDDAIVVSGGTIAIYVNNGTGDGSFGSGSVYYYDDPAYFPFINGPLRVAAGKTSGGHWNIAVTGPNQPYWGFLYSVNSDGTLAPNPQILLLGTGYPALELKFVDVNKNGLPCLVVKGPWGDPVSVFANDGSGNFGNSGPNTRPFNYQIPTFSLPAVDGNYFQSGVEFIDMDHDGILDLVVLTADGTNGWINTVYWYEGLGGSNFDGTAHTAWAGGSNPAQYYNKTTWVPGAYVTAFAADFDGDGQVNLALSNQVTQPIILKNNGDGTFSPGWAAPLTDSLGNPAFAEFLAYVDVTGTGQKSLVGSNPTNNSEQFFTPYGEFYGAPSTTPLDTTPPVITPNVSGTLGSGGWYTSNVSVSWTVTDAESAVSSTTGCDASAVTADTPGVTFTCNATSAGGSNSAAVTIKRDATAPALSASATAGNNPYVAGTWSKVPVTVTFTCADATSGVQSYTSPVTVSGNGAGQAASGVCLDVAGNTATATFTGIDIDTIAPTVTASITPMKRGGDDESTQTFVIRFSATDNVTVTTLTAVLNGITVTNGQVVTLKTIKSGPQRARRDDGRLQIDATSFVLVVTAKDAAGNPSSMTVVPVFNKDGHDSEDRDKDHHDRKDR